LFRALALTVVACAACFGYGGFELTSSFVRLRTLNEKFTELNRGWGGSEAFMYHGPLLWLGGHGGGFVSPVMLGGGGALGVKFGSADSLEAELAGARAFLDAGYPYAPIDQFWARGCLELGGGVWTHHIHYKESFSDSDFSRWWLGWAVGMAPGIEVMGRIRYQSDMFAGIFLKASWFIPFTGPQSYGDSDPPAFGLGGFNLQVGLRFGKYPPRPFKM